MEDHEVANLVQEHLASRLSAIDGLEPVIWICDISDDDTEFENPNQCQVRSTILRPSADFVVFFDQQGRILGWRDDGRVGANARKTAKREEFRLKSLAELDLPNDTELGNLKSAELAPIGWVVEGVLFANSNKEPKDIFDVWSNPDSLKIIQWTVREGSGSGATNEEQALANAGQCVSAALRTRLKPKTLTISEDFYFAVSPQNLEKTHAGFQVRVKTWKHWSDAYVDLDRQTGKISGDWIDRLASPKSSQSLGEAGTLSAISPDFTIPPDAIFDQHQHQEIANAHFVDTLNWGRAVDGLPVDGDEISVSLHPETHEIVRYNITWSDLRIAPASSTISQEAALSIVEQNRQSLNIGDEFDFDEIELKLAALRHPTDIEGAATHVRAWFLTYGSDFGEVVVLIKASDGQFLEIRRSS